MTKYEQIIYDIKNDINGKKYKTSKKLPSVRDLSLAYNCSKSTVIKAYESLKNSHLIYSVPQSGYYVVEEHITPISMPNTFIDFSTGNPNIGKILTPDLKHCLNRAVDIYANQPIDPDVYGIDSLRHLLPSYLAKFQVFTSVDNIFINLGIQQILSILTNMPFPNDKKNILVENPTYRYFISFLENSGIKPIGIERNEYGIDLNELEHIFKYGDIKFFYTIPRNHNPLGTRYSKSQRLAIADLAKKYNVYIVEDDYFGDIEFDSKYDPIYSYGDHHNFIYLKSFTKIIPWIKLGLTVVPDHLIDDFKLHANYSYYYSYFAPSLVSQATLEIYLKSNLLSKHIKSIKTEHKIRLNLLKEKMGELSNLNISFTKPTWGFYSYIFLPEYINEDLFAKKLGDRGIKIAKGRPYFLSNSTYKKGIRLSVAKPNTNEIITGMDEIITLLKNGYQ
ncbi:PLP-dependent aminotransferase family protein [Clostridium paridis]|uniref:PLP-dependent aminotransferase family protein n=1 Tax=Clostridium paridis TaxID=2803863 RepID=A0A937FJI0_9CLOT|nr:PLP-dependent aminotransferase family protein [Clostridium paridis]MBL4932956.1 PLP-dependent aminotransferase family protein [Clostridium paridis]